MNLLSLKEILIKYPSSLSVFKEYKLNLYQYSDESLEKVLIQEGLDEISILEKINVLNKEDLAKNNDLYLQNKDINVLISKIDQIHEELFYELPKLGALVKTILRVHGQTHQELTYVFRLFSKLTMVIDEHLIKEETYLYSKIDNQEFDNRKVILKDLVGEHKEILEIFKELRKVTKDYLIPPDVCGTYIKTYKMLEELDYNVFNHLLFEEKFIFDKINEI